jgi:flagellar M-ring protein FliF
MEQLRKIVSALSWSQRIGIAAAFLFLVGGIISFVHWRKESDFRPLFTGMPAEDAAAIVQKLKESGVEHRLTDNGTSVLVPAAKVDELRIELAGAGLPRSGRIGFELFDKTNLGVTDFAEHVNYRRALEGELERSIRSLTDVEQARVHITFPKDSVFLDSREPAKASVLLTLHPGAHLAQPNVVAITNLLASAVEGLNPEYVSVVDMRGNLLSRPKKMSGDAQDPSDAALEYEHQLEKDLTQKVEATLTPLLGEDRFRVGISADCDFSTSEQTDETFDPTHSVLTSSQKSEDLSGGAASAGVPGTASNAPRSTLRPVGGGGIPVSRRTENVAYETSRSVRSVKVPRGNIRRLSASLLVDQEMQWQGSGAKRKQVLVPMSPEKLKAIHDLVAGVIGLNAARGDQLVVENLAFEQNHMDELANPAANPAGSVPAALWWKNPKLLIGAGAGVVLLGALAAFLLRKRKLAVQEAEPAKLLSAAEASAENDAEAGNKQLDAAPNMQLLPVADQALHFRTHLRESVAQNPLLAANVLRSWIDEEAAA